jgi:hypothetical protein
MENDMQKEFIDMAERCKHEIIILRQQIARLSPKAEAYDNLAAVLRLLPQPSQGMGEDLVWRIEKRLAELRSNPVEANPPENGDT